MVNHRKVPRIAVLLTCGFLTVQLAAFQGTGGAEGPGSTIEQLVDRAAVVIEGSVQSVFPPPERSNGAIGVDVLIRVDKVLKGQDPGQQIVVAQLIGASTPFGQLQSQVRRMQSGEHYVLLISPYRDPSKITPEERARRDAVITGAGLRVQPDPPALPDRGNPRYVLLDQQTGVFSIEGGVVRVGPVAGQALKEKYEGMGSAQFIALIEAHAAARR